MIKLGGIWRVAVFLIAGLTPAGMSCAGQDSGAIVEVDKAWIEISPPVDHAYKPLVNYGFHSMDGAKPDAPLTLICRHVWVWHLEDHGPRLDLAPREHRSQWEAAGQRDQREQP